VHRLFLKISFYLTEIKLQKERTNMQELWQLYWIWGSCNGVCVKSAVFWVLMLWSLEGAWCFRGKSPPSSGLRSNTILKPAEASRNLMASCHLLLLCFFAFHNLWPWRWWQYVPQKYQGLSELHRIKTHFLSLHRILCNVLLLWIHYLKKYGNNMLSSGYSHTYTNL
jgi:hypothetical protein